MQLGQVHTGSKQSVVFASRRLRFATGAGESLDPKTLLRFKRRSCSDFAKTRLKSAAKSRCGVCAEAGTTNSAEITTAARTRRPADLGVLSMPCARCILSWEAEARTHLMMETEELCQVKHQNREHAQHMQGNRKAAAGVCRGRWRSAATDGPALTHATHRV